MNTLLTIIHIIVSILLIGLIVLQSEGSGLSSAITGGAGSYHSKRGMERIVFGLTIVLAGLFLITSLLNFWLQ